MTDSAKISTCVFHSLAILSVHSRHSSIFLIPRSSTRPFLHRVASTISLPAKARPLFSATVTLPRPWKLDSIFRPFCKVLFFRNGGSTIVFPRAVPLRSRSLVPFPSIWPRYIDDPATTRLSLPPISYSLHVGPDWKVCSAENSREAEDIRRRYALYRRPANFADPATRRYLLKEASLDRYPKHFYSSRLS